MIEDLIIRTLQGHATPPEKDQVRRWRMKAPENDERYREIEALWALTGVAAPAVLEPEPPRIEDLPVLSEAIVANDARREAPAAAEVAHTPRQFVKARPVRPWTMIGGIAATVTAASFGLGAALSRVEEPNTPIAYSEIVTGDGEMATVTLSDGSAIRVGPHSTLRFSQEGREPVVWLDGQAFFGVQSDSTRRFIVRTEHGEAVALGTRFEVQSGDEEFRVLVVEGSVRVSAAGAAVELSEGLMSESRDGAPPSTSRVEDVHEHLAWLGTTLMFRNTPLGRAIAEIENRYRVDVALDAAELEDLTVTATFTEQRAEQVVFVICEMIGARCVVDADGNFHIAERVLQPPSPVGTMPGR